MADRPADPFELHASAHRSQSSESSAPALAYWMLFALVSVGALVAMTSLASA